MKVIITRNARTELREIRDFIASDDPLAAERLVTNLRSGCLGLAGSPDRGKLFAERRGVTLRRLVIGSYLILYSVSPDTVRIHRIIHGSRSPRAFLKDIDFT